MGVLVLRGLILPYIDAVDEYLVTNTYSPIVLSVFIALSVLLYPAGNTWTPARSVGNVWTPDRSVGNVWTPDRLEEMPIVYTSETGHVNLLHK